MRRSPKNTSPRTDWWMFHYGCRCWVSLGQQFLSPGSFAFENKLDWLVNTVKSVCLWSWSMKTCLPALHGPDAAETAENSFDNTVCLLNRWCKTIVWILSVVFHSPLCFWATAWKSWVCKVSNFTNPETFLSPIVTNLELVNVSLANIDAAAQCLNAKLPLGLCVAAVALETRF